MITALNLNLNLVRYCHGRLGLSLSHRVRNLGIFRRADNLQGRRYRTENAEQLLEFSTRTSDATALTLLAKGIKAIKWRANAIVFSGYDQIIPCP